MKIWKSIGWLACAAAACFVTTAHAQSQSQRRATEDWLRGRAVSGDVLSEYELGAALIGHGSRAIVTQSVPEGLDWLNKAAAAGSPHAMLMLGKLAFFGIDVPHDKAVALDWFDKSAAAGLAYGDYIMCIAYTSGGDVMPDYDRAFPHCLQAADLRNPDRSSPSNFVPYAYRRGAARFLVAKAYAEGKGVDRDDQEAANQLLTAATAGSPEALTYLNDWFAKDSFVPSGDASAFYRKALAVGALGAGAKLAPLTKDDNESARLYALAASVNNPAAKTWMAQHPGVTEASLAANRIPLFGEKTSRFTYIFNGEKVDMWVYAAKITKDKYPTEATADAVEGKAVVDCHWNSQGQADTCALLEEAPAGYGFGQAAIDFVTQPVAVTDHDQWVKLFANKSTRSTQLWQIR